MASLAQTTTFDASSLIFHDISVDHEPVTVVTSVTAHVWDDIEAEDGTSQASAASTLHSNRHIIVAITPA